MSVLLLVVEKLNGLIKCTNRFVRRSQSKASYLSAYKREPREREKGLPNFEGSYKRTASPNSGGRADAAAAVEPQGESKNYSIKGSMVVETGFEIKTSYGWIKKPNIFLKSKNL